MIARRPAWYWGVLAGVLVVAVLAARSGLGLLRSVERAPHRIEWALKARIAAGEAQAAVGALEVARRGYRLQPLPARLETLRREHAQLHATFGMLRIAVAGDPRLLEALDYAERAVGVWTDDLVPLTAAAARAPTLPARDAPTLELVRGRLGALIAEADRAHAEAQREVRVRHRRAEWLWGLGTGLLFAILVVLHDLAYRRRQRVVEAARRMDLLLGALPFALLGLDRTLRIRQATGFIHRVLGATTRDVRGLAVTDLVAPADRATLAAAVQTALDGAARECLVVTSGDSHPAHALSIMCSPIREDTAIVGVSAVVHDVTAEQALRAQVLQSDRLATVGALVAGVVHEINNPLTAVITQAALMDRSRLEADDREALACIASEAQRAAYIARNLLDFSRQQRRPYEPTDLGAVVARTVALRRYELTAGGVQLASDCPDGVPPVKGDAQQLQQVVLNLLINAEHAVRGRDDRRIAIRLAPAPGVVRLVVEDSGPGVPAHRRSTVFDPFFTTKPAGEGTGLGLSVSRGIVDAHGGRIRVEPGALGGARFVVEFPAVAGTGAAAADRGAAGRGLTAAPLQSHIGGGGSTP